MFYVHEQSGVRDRLPLEKLLLEESLRRIQKVAAARKKIVVPRDQSETSTDRSFTIAQKAYRQALGLDDGTVEILYAQEIMSSPVLTLEPETPIVEAWNRMQQQGIRHLPIVRGERDIIGIVSQSDLLRRLVVKNGEVQNFSEEKVEKVMSYPVISTSRVTDIRRIAKAMFDCHIGTMLVLDDLGNLAGIITRSDILFALIHYPALKLWG